MKDRVKDIEVAEMGRKLLEMGTRLSTTSSDARGRIHVDTGEAQGESLHNTLVVVVPVLGHSGHGSQPADYPLNEEEEQDGQPCTPLLDSELRAIIERRIIDDATLRETNERLQGELEGVYQERSDLAAQLSARYGQPKPGPETENRTAVAAVAQSGSTSLKYYEYENFIPRPEPSTWSVGLTSSRLVDRPTLASNRESRYDTPWLRFFSTSSRTLDANDSTVLSTSSIDDRQQRAPSVDGSPCSDNSELLVERLREPEEPDLDCGWDTDETHRAESRQSSEELSDREMIARGLRMYRERFAIGDNGSESQLSDRSPCGSDWTDYASQEDVKFGGKAGDRGKYRTWSKCWNGLDVRLDLDRGYGR